MHDRFMSENGVISHIQTLTMNAVMLELPPRSPAGGGDRRHDRQY